MHDKIVIRYLGCIGVSTSMRRLDEDQRCMVTDESINRLCIANNIERSNDEKTQHYSIDQMLDKEPNLMHSGKHVKLCITPKYLNVLDKDSKNKIIVQHEMPNVSFASSKVNETGDFVAYIGKNREYERACFVLQCNPKKGKELLNKIHDCFKLRTQQIKTSRNNTNALIEKSPTLSQDSFNGTLTNVSLHTTDANDTSLDAPNQVVYETYTQNEALIAETRASLEGEPWFHGSYLSREESETRLKLDGDFLVRESMLDPGHFVLSVMNEGTKLHLLFDSIAQVRTRELVFDNISQLVSYHHTQGTPIVAENRAVLLKNGVRPSPRVVKQPKQVVNRVVNQTM